MLAGFLLSRPIHFRPTIVRFPSGVELFSTISPDHETLDPFSNAPPFLHHTASCKLRHSPFDAWRDRRPHLASSSSSSSSSSFLQSASHEADKPTWPIRSGKGCQASKASADLSVPTANRSKKKKEEKNLTDRQRRSPTSLIPQ